MHAAARVAFPSTTIARWIGLELNVERKPRSAVEDRILLFDRPGKSYHQMLMAESTKCNAEITASGYLASRSSSSCPGYFRNDDDDGGSGDET
jgi:hypothetical protein